MNPQAQTNEYSEYGQEFLLDTETIPEVQHTEEPPAPAEPEESAQAEFSKKDALIDYVVGTRGSDREDWKVTYTGEGYRFDGNEIFDENGQSITQLVQNNPDQNNIHVQAHYEMLSFFKENPSGNYLMPDYPENLGDIIRTNTTGFYLENGVLYPVTVSFDEKIEKNDSDESTAMAGANLNETGDSNNDSQSNNNLSVLDSRTSTETNVAFASAEQVQESDSDIRAGIDTPDSYTYFTPKSEEIVDSAKFVSTDTDKVFYSENNADLINDFKPKVNFVEPFAVNSILIPDLEPKPSEDAEIAATPVVDLVIKKDTKIIDKPAIGFDDPTIISIDLPKVADIVSEKIEQQKQVLQTEKTDEVQAQNRDEVQEPDIVVARDTSIDSEVKVNSEVAAELPKAEEAKIVEQEMLAQTKVVETEGLEKKNEDELYEQKVEFLQEAETSFYTVVTSVTEKETVKASETTETFVENVVYKVEEEHEDATQVTHESVSTVDAQAQAQATEQSKSNATDIKETSTEVGSLVFDQINVKSEIIASDNVEPVLKEDQSLPKVETKIEVIEKVDPVVIQNENIINNSDVVEHAPVFSEKEVADTAQPKPVESVPEISYTQTENIIQAPDIVDLPRTSEVIVNESEPQKQVLQTEKPNNVQSQNIDKTQKTDRTVVREAPADSEVKVNSEVAAELPKAEEAKIVEQEMLAQTKVVETEGLEKKTEDEISEQKVEVINETATSSETAAKFVEKAAESEAEAHKEKQFVAEDYPVEMKNFDVENIDDKETITSLEAQIMEIFGYSTESATVDQTITSNEQNIVRAAETEKVAPSLSGNEIVLRSLGYSGYSSAASVSADEQSTVLQSNKTRIGERRVNGISIRTTV